MMIVEPLVCISVAFEDEALADTHGLSESPCNSCLR